MSRENVEVVRRMYDAYARGDYELTLSYHDPEIEFSQPAQEPGAGTYHGHQGIIRAMTKWVGAWDDYRVEVEELVDSGDHVLAKTRHHGRGKSSGVEVERQIFQLYTLRNGRIVRTRMYYDEAEARKAAGMRA
jgi:ketosteroid isomerase-like protein